MFCQQSTETHDHLFFECSFATELWQQFCTEWNLNLNLRGREAFITTLKKLKMARKLRSLIQAMTNAVIYHIWQARNMLFKEYYQVHSILKDIKAQILQRVLQIHQHRQKYKTCIDFLLHRK